MTDKTNEDSPPNGSDAPMQTDSPIDELAKIIGYEDEPQPESQVNAAPGEAALDLEAELLREFGVQETPAAPEPLLEPAPPVVPVNDDVLADISKYQLPENTVSEPETPAASEPVIEPNGAAVSAGATILSSQRTTNFGATAERQTPPEEEPVIEEPQAAEPSSPFLSDRPASSSLAKGTSYGASAASTFDEVSSKLDAALAQFKSSMPEAEAEVAVTEEPEPIAEPEAIVEPESQFVDPQSVEAATENINAESLLPEVPVFPTPEIPEALMQPAPDEIAASEPVLPEIPRIEDILQENSAQVPEIEAPEIGDMPLRDTMEVEPIDLPEVSAQPDALPDMPEADVSDIEIPELQDVVNVSEFEEVESGVEAATDFEVPPLDDEDLGLADSGLDVDLDLELEKEFSQLLADDLAYDDADPSADAGEGKTAAEMASVISLSKSDGKELDADEEIDELSELFQVGDSDNQGKDAAGAASMAAAIRPERIDVTGDADIPQSLAAGSSDNGGGSHINSMLIVGALATVVFAGAVYLFWQNWGDSGSTSTEPVIIAADNSPIKELPTDPGGASVPNQDQAVYDQVEGNNVDGTRQSELVETKEEPVDIVQRTINPNILPLEGRPADTEDKGDERLLPNAEVAQNATEAEPLVAPRRVRTVIVQSDGTIITREEPETPAVQADTPQPTTPSAQEAPATNSASGASTETEIAIVTPQPSQPEQPAVAVTPQPETSTPTAPLSDDTATALLNATPAVPERPAEDFSGYYMQISSQPSLDAAQASYRNLSNRYSSLIGGRGVEYQKAVISGKGTFHRVRIQVGTRDEANALCARFKSAGGSCFVAK